MVFGLLAIGIVFAMISSRRYYLKLTFTSQQRETMDVDFYYTANATGRLLGTLAS